jgi:hypothetical protein
VLYLYCKKCCVDFLHESDDLKKSLSGTCLWCIVVWFIPNLLQVLDPLKSFVARDFRMPEACLYICKIFITPYLRVYKPHFLTRISLQNWGCGLCTEYYVILTTEPATPVLCVVKLPVETVSVWDCYLASYCTRANAPTYYWCIGTFWLHESSRHHQFPEVGRPWHHWQITVNAASDHQSAANAIANILLSHR